MVLTSLYVRYSVDVDGIEKALELLRELQPYLRVKACVSRRDDRTGSQVTECELVAGDTYEIFVGELTVLIERHTECTTYYSSHYDGHVTDDEMNKKFSEAAMYLMGERNYKAIEDVYEEISRSEWSDEVRRACIRTLSARMWLSGNLIAVVDSAEGVYPKMVLWRVFSKYGSVRRNLFRSM